MPTSFDPASLSAYADPSVLTQTQPQPEPKKNPSMWGLGALTAAGNIADAGSTMYALNKTPLASEGNPLLPGGSKAIMALKGAMTIPEIYLEKKMIDSGHPTIAKVMAGALAGLGGAMAYHNIKAVQGK